MDHQPTDPTDDTVPAAGPGDPVDTGDLIDPDAPDAPPPPVVDPDDPSYVEPAAGAVRVDPANLLPPGTLATTTTSPLDGDPGGRA